MLIDIMLGRMMNDGEYVKEIEGFKGYYITNFGRVISGKKTRKNKTLKGDIHVVRIYRVLKPFNTGGYDRVTLVKNGRKHNMYVHELVMANFRGLHNKANVRIEHLDGDKSNNNVENLIFALRKTPTLN